MTNQKTSTAEKGKKFLADSGKYVFWLTWPGIWVITRFQKNRTRVVVKSGNKVLLVKSWLGPRHWELPGGGLKPLGEDSREGAVRELHEEVGIIAKPDKLEELGVFRNLSQNGLTIHAHAYLLTVSTQPDLQLHRWEIVEADWLDLDQLPARGVDKGTQEIINRAVHSSRV